MRAWILIVGLALAAVRPAHAGDDVDAVVASTMARLHVPGMAVAIVRDGKLEKRASYGVANVEWQAPVTDDTRFQIASSTKVFTGTLVMLLVQEGKLRLDAPLSTYLPDAPAAWRAITIAQLAAHASGIPEPAAQPRGTLASETASLATRPLAYASGSRATYGVSDYIVLAHVLEKVTGTAFTDLLRTRIFEPLRFTCTTFDGATDIGPTRSADVIPQRASVYRWTGDHQRTAWFFYPEATYASGGLWSCASDLAKWAIALDEGRLLSAASERRAATSLRLAGGGDAGWGVVFSTGTLRGHRTYGHSGGPALADIVRVPDKRLTVIVLANQQRLHPMLAGLIAGMRLPAARPRPVRDAQPALSRTLRGVVDQLGTGKLAEAPFAARVRGDLVPALRDWGPVMVAPLPPVDRFVLVDDRRDRAHRIRRYRATHGPLATAWTFMLDPAGAIVELEIAPD